MVTACGAEARITQRYAEWVQEVRKKGQYIAPLLALQFGLIVSVLVSIYTFLADLIPLIVFRALLRFWSRILVWYQIICRRTAQ
jgi:hypothetical protein